MADILISDYGADLYSQGFYSYRVGWLFEAAQTIQFDAVAQFKATMNFSGAATILVVASNYMGIIHPYDASASFTFSVVSNLQGIRNFSVELTIPLYVISEEYMGYPWVPDVPSKGLWIPIGPDKNPNSGWTTYG